MKAILALCGLTLLVGSIAVYRATRSKTLYGEFIGAPKAQVAEIIAHPKDYMGKTRAIEGAISKQCTSMGCFFFFEADGKQLRVDLAEIAMHAPKNRNGKPARVEGQMVPYGDGYQFWASAVEFR